MRCFSVLVFRVASCCYAERVDRCLICMKFYDQQKFFVFASFSIFRAQITSNKLFASLQSKTCFIIVTMYFQSGRNFQLISYYFVVGPNSCSCFAFAASFTFHSRKQEAQAVGWAMISLRFQIIERTLEIAARKFLPRCIASFDQIPRIMKGS